MEKVSYDGLSYDAHNQHYSFPSKLQQITRRLKHAIVSKCIKVDVYLQTLFFKIFR